MFAKISIRSLALPFLALLIVALAVSAAHAVQASADKSTEYSKYRNDQWRFSLVVPDDMTAQLHDQAGDGQTIQFLDEIGDYKFQVSAWPYTQLDLTHRQEGMPGTTADQPNKLETVDIVRDDLFTVLFQKNGVRYVVTALPRHEAWLTEILTTWQFTD